MIVTPLLLVLALGAADPCDASPTTLVDKVLRITGLDATAKGPADPAPEGDLFLAATTGGPPFQRLTDQKKLRSPLFVDDDYLVALQGRKLVRVKLDGDLTNAPLEILDLPGAVRLAGLVEEKQLLLVALVEKDQRQYPEVICLGTGSRTSLDQVAASEKVVQELGQLLPRLRRAERRYGDTLLRTETNKDKGRDVVSLTDGKRTPITRCEKEHCTQGALSPDGSLVVYVKTAPRLP